MRALVAVLAAMLFTSSAVPASAQLPEFPDDCTEATTAGNIFIGHDCGEYASILISGRIIIRKPWSRANRANRGARLRDRREGGTTPTAVPANSDPSSGPVPNEPVRLFGIDVSGGDTPGELDCGDFASPEEAQALWDEQGWTKRNDPYNLDGGLNTVDDGIPCED